MAFAQPGALQHVDRRGWLCVGVDTCPNVYQSLNGRLPAQITRIQGRLAFQLNPTLPSAATAAVIAGQIQQAYLKNSIATAAATAADLIRQNAVLNAIEDTSKIVGQKVNDPAAMVLAVGRAQAVAQQNATWLNYGKVAEQALPVFQRGRGGDLRDVPPLRTAALLTSGRETMLAFKGYAAVLIWIQLWPPLYAILNHGLDLRGLRSGGRGRPGHRHQGTGPADRIHDLFARAISGEAVVGYLRSASLHRLGGPQSAWRISGRRWSAACRPAGDDLGEHLGIHRRQRLHGERGMDQMQLAPNRTSAFMGSWQNDLSGNTFSSNA